jgi:hypothetical protein
MIFHPSFEKGHKGNSTCCEIQAAFGLFGQEIGARDQVLGVRFSKP